METNILRLAIQKKGRLADNSLELLKSAGIRIDNYSQQLLIKAQNFDLELLFIRDDDIPEYVQDGIADIGIVGENVILESGKQLKTIEKLGFGKCRMSIAIPKAKEFSSISDLEGKNIATTYPKILNNYLTEKQIKAKVHYISGSVEITPNINLADAIFDIVSTGSTLISNGLKEVEVVMNSEAVLISNENLSTQKIEILDRLIRRIKAARNASENKYILLNAPNDSIEKICSLLPGMKAPTILPLATTGWSSLHSVVKEDQFWDIIDQLKELGAQGILVVPIEKMVL